MKDITEYPDAHLRIFDRPAVPTANDLKSAYLIGICGTGMGSLAGLFSESGVKVFGSDAAAYPPMSDQLAMQGIKVYEGFEAGRIDGRADLIVVGNACSPTHVEATRARELALPQVSLPEALASYYIRDRKSLVVAGTHGKTTTTSLLLHLFRSAGLDPGYLVGGVLSDHSKSYSVGTGNFFIIEGDEYDSAYFDKRPKFLHYRPRTAIVTSIEFDHADIYDSFEDYIEAFQAFVDLIPTGGLLVRNADDPQCMALSIPTGVRSIEYGLTSANCTLTAARVEGSDEGQSFDIVLDGETFGRVHLALCGEHNLMNALAVCAIAIDENLSIRHIRQGLRSFAGIQRRQQIRGIVSDIIVIDDFAHHPTAVRATIESIRGRWPDRRLVAVFEPRSNSSRRRVFEEGYARAFDQADAVFLSRPPFRHNDRAEDFMDIDRLLGRIESPERTTVAAEGADALLKPLLDFIRKGDVVLIMSNGGFGDIHDRILQALSARSGIVGT